MNLKKNALLLTLYNFVLCVVVSCSVYAGMPSAPTSPGDIQLTPEEIEMLNAMNKAVEEEKAKMSPDDRKLFDARVDALTKEFEAMKPDEFQAFIDQVVFSQQPPSAQPAQPQIPMILPEPEPIQEVQILKKIIPADKVDLAVSLINVLIESINSFLNKVAIAPEFEGKLKKWTEQGKIRDWKPEYTWEIVKKNCDELIQKLYKIKSQNDEDEYIYLKDFVDNDALFNNLNELKNVLQDKEPLIEVEAFGLEPLTKKSRSAIRTILTSLVKALYVDEVSKALNVVIEKFDPEAKRLHDIEDAATKKALEESKKIKFPTQTGVSGKGQEAYGRRPAYPDYGGLGAGGYYGSGYPTGYEGRASGKGIEGLEKGEGKEPKEGKKGGEAGPGKDEKGKEGKDKEKEKKEKTEKDTVAKRQTDKFNANLDQAAEAIANSRLPKLKSHLDNRNEPLDMETINNLRTIVKKLDAATNNITSLKNRFKDLKDDQKKLYKAEIKIVYEEHLPVLDNVLLQIRDVKVDQNKYSEEQRYYYLGGPAPKVKDGGKKEALAPSSGYSLSDLQRAIEELKKAYKAL